MRFSIIKPYFQQLLFVFLAFAAMVAMSFWYVKDVVERQAEINGNAAIEYAESTVRTLLADTEVLLINMAFTVEELIAREDSNEALSNLFITGSNWYNTRSQRYFAFRGIRGYLRGQYFDGTGWVKDGNTDPPSRGWYIRAIQSKGVYHSVPYVDADAEKVYFTVSQKIYNRNNEVAGVVALDFDISATSMYIRNLQSSGGGYSILLNDKLQILSHKNSSLLGRSFGEAVPEYASLAVRLLQGEDRLSAVEVRDYSGSESVVFMSQLFNGWYVGIVTPVSIYYDKVRRMAFMLTLLGVTLASLLCVLLIRLYSAKEEADTRSRMKSSFLARMSHEIRTPMNAILGMTEMILRDELSIPKKTFEAAVIIRQAGQNLLTIINDILDLTKIESGNVEIVSEPYLLTSLLNDIINIMRWRIYEKDLRFVLYVDSKIPNNLIGDEVHVRQIFLNLLTNAAKYTDRGHVDFSLRIERKDNSTLVLKAAVADTGRGIRQEDMDKIFGDFVRLDIVANKQVEGTGLGLPITKNLVGKMGGEITISSVYGEGSCFTVTIPQGYVEGEPFAKVDNAASHNVLFAGTTKMYLDSISETLTNLDVAHTVVTTPEDFRAKLATNTFSFILVGESIFNGVSNMLGKLEIPIVILTENVTGSAWEYRSVLLPAHALSIANALNKSVNDDDVHVERIDTSRFRAPTARILVVDDIRTNLKVVEGLLLPYQVQVDFCLGGEEAVMLAKDTRYDFILMDHMMPGMDGVEAAQRIKLMPESSDIPIIALTANAVSGMREFFLESGMDDFIAKPIEPLKLDALMAKWIPAEKQEKYIQTNVAGSGLFEGWYLPGVDFVTGLKRFSGNETAYMQVIKSFIAHTPAVLDGLQTSGKESLGGYAIAVHGIKGSSAGIGAEDVAALAQSLETAAKSGDMDTVQAKTPLFVKMVHALIQGLGMLVDGLDDSAPRQKRAVPEKLLLKKLSNACREYDIESMEEAMRELEHFEYEVDPDLVPWLRKQVDTLEYESLLEKIREILGDH